MTALIIRTMNANVPVLEEKICKIIATSGRDDLQPYPKRPETQSLLTFKMYRRAGISQSMKHALQNLQSSKVMIIMQMPDVF
jgi:hypothetical protein